MSSSISTCPKMLLSSPKACRSAPSTLHPWPVGNRARRQGASPVRANGSLNPTGLSLNSLTSRPDLCWLCRAPLISCQPVPLLKSPQSLLLPQSSLRLSDHPGCVEDPVQTQFGSQGPTPFRFHFRPTHSFPEHLSVLLSPGMSILPFPTASSARGRCCGLP